MRNFYLLLAILIVSLGCTSNEDVTIPDATLATAVREALGLAPHAPIPQKELRKLEKLVAIQKDIKDLIGLEKASGLTDLTLESNRIRDITPLSGLTRITTLELAGNKIRDITPLTQLTQLTRLYLSNNQVSDITPLANLTQLEMVRHSRGIKLAM